MTTTVPFGTQSFPTFGTQPTPFFGFTPGFNPGFNPFTGIPFGYAYPGTPIASTIPGTGCCTTTTNGATTVTPTQGWTPNGVPTPDQTVTAQGFVGQPGTTIPFGYTGGLTPWTSPVAYSPFGAFPNFGYTPTFGTGMNTFGVPTFGAGINTFGGMPTIGAAPTFGGTPFGTTSPWGWTPGTTGGVFAQTPWFQPSFTNSVYGTPTSFPFAQNSWYSPTSTWNNPFTTPFGWTGGANPFSCFPQSFPGATQTPSFAPWTNSSYGTGTTGYTPWSFQQTPWMNCGPSFTPGFNGLGTQPFSTWSGAYNTAYPAGIFSFPQNFTSMTTAGCYQPSFYTPGVSVPFGYGAVPFSTPFGQTFDSNGRRGIGIREAA